MPFTKDLRSDHISFFGLRPVKINLSACAITISSKQPDQLTVLFNSHERFTM
ncbi:hypothetical protein L248_1727 [Schleiferilactobacillus shenzhenensis LY-73]|uniref:Uncharacterized protein n=1 Tax=Schleiferilactobacillus shenzhenensis LY-73 TaxID=1231336 RepID=U4TIH7_9LACO|nr:hypothetical protein L248_1727 [Schleiferilactobacillus shenzhenensis LY-73]